MTSMRKDIVGPLVAVAFLVSGCKSSPEQQVEPIPGSDATQPYPVLSLAEQIKFSRLRYVSLGRGSIVLQDEKGRGVIIDANRFVDAIMVSRGRGSVCMAREGAWEKYLTMRGALLNGEAVDMGSIRDILSEAKSCQLNMANDRKRK